MEIYAEDLKIDVYRSSGAPINEANTCVRITHLPTGIVVKSEDPKKGYHYNRDKALELLKAQLD